MTSRSSTPSSSFSELDFSPPSTPGRSFPRRAISAPKDGCDVSLSIPEYSQARDRTRTSSSRPRSGILSASALSLSSSRLTYFVIVFLLSFVLIVLALNVRDVVQKSRKQGRLQDHARELDKVVGTFEALEIHLDDTRKDFFNVESVVHNLVDRKDSLRRKLPHRFDHSPN